LPPAGRSRSTGCGGGRRQKRDHLRDVVAAIATLPPERANPGSLCGAANAATRPASDGMRPAQPEAAITADSTLRMQRTSDAPAQVVFDTWWPDHASLSHDRLALFSRQGVVS
jgi:hypothetical protein